ncbi:MAG: winged helix-turn-helix transcriptional regulator [Culicoidibacterales bacterium]
MNDLDHQYFCPLEAFATAIGGKWKLRIIWYLEKTPVLRFNELKREVGDVTDLMLTKSLKELIEVGIVSRHQYNEVPPRVEYALTQQGKELLVALEPVVEWTNVNLGNRAERAAGMLQEG